MPPGTLFSRSREITAQFLATHVQMFIFHIDYIQKTFAID